jgi:hypothetical protein
MDRAAAMWRSVRRMRMDDIKMTMRRRGVMTMRRTSGRRRIRRGRMRMQTCRMRSESGDRDRLNQ